MGGLSDSHPNKQAPIHTVLTNIIAQFYYRNHNYLKYNHSNHKCTIVFTTSSQFNHDSIGCKTIVLNMPRTVVTKLNYNKTIIFLVFYVLRHLLHLLISHQCCIGVVSVPLQCVLAGKTSSTIRQREQDVFYVEKY